MIEYIACITKILDGYIKYRKNENT